MQTAVLEQVDPLLRLRKMFPMLMRSRRYAEVEKMVEDGDLAGAEEMAKQILARNPRMRIENIIARRMRVERASLFTRLSKGEKELRSIFDRLGGQLADKVGRKADARGNLPYLYASVHQTAVEMKRELKKWMTAIVKDSARTGLLNAGNAFLPIFKDNWEAVLQEDKMSFGLDKKFANRTDPRIGMGSVKWKDKVATIVKRQAKTNMTGQSFSEKIWDLGARAERDMKRLVAEEIYKGTSPDTIARRIKKYMSPSITSADELTEPLARGVYASAFKNAWRLARTEAGKAYTHSSAEFAKDKKWITAVRITISPTHDWSLGCDCESHNGKEVSPSEFQDLVPFHPHCMCYPTYIIDDEFLSDVTD